MAGNDRSAGRGRGAGGWGWVAVVLGYTERGSGLVSTAGSVGLYVPRGYPLGTEVFAREIYRRRPGGFIVTAALEGIVNPRLRIADTKFYVGH